MGSRRETGEKTERGYVKRGREQLRQRHAASLCYQQLTSCICGDGEWSGVEHQEHGVNSKVRNGKGRQESVPVPAL
jgi:hypothetical protein